MGLVSEETVETVVLRRWVICSDEGLTLETSAFQSLYGGQFTLSTPLINQIFLFYIRDDLSARFSARMRNCHKSDRSILKMDMYF